MRDILTEKNMLSLLTVVTVYLAVWGGITADAQVGSVLRNSIRHLPAASSPSDAVSAARALPAPRTATLRYVITGC